ncbi:hypothetical protein SESBI_49316 [Sesbania bispinosa]|nr:hypothetical protein SESBI_49316 [Sesbania bispinosa]
MAVAVVEIIGLCQGWRVLGDVMSLAMVEGGDGGLQAKVVWQWYRVLDGDDGEGCWPTIAAVWRVLKDSNNGGCQLLVEDVRYDGVRVTVMENVG